MSKSPREVLLFQAQQHYKDQLLAEQKHKTMQYKSPYICPVRNSIKQKRLFDSYSAAQGGKQEAIELQGKHALIVASMKLPCVGSWVCARSYM